ncbi:MAG: DUF4157 domain-containing protein [Myxococcales bacterium]|nr:DUF4157 domain-containing protein [Myxococcales bacterium]
MGAGAVQRAATANGSDAGPGDVHAAAATGIAGPAGALPFADVIQRSFGAHDLSAIQAHVGGPAAAASAAMGAEAYATGHHVAFARAPDLHTAAHEAAHVVQQRAGVQLQGGVGEVGDAYEQQADAVADAVVRGESAEHLLGAADAGATGAAGPDVQRKAAGAAGELPGGVGRLTPVQVELGRAVNKLQALEARAERAGRGLAAGGLSPDEACAALAQLVGEAFAPVMLLGIHVANVRHETAKNQADRSSMNPFKRGEASRGEARAGAHDHTMETSLEEAFKALDNLVRVSLAVMRQAEATPARQRLASTIDSLSAQASPLGWTRPESLEVATARRYAREACPPGSDQERADVCDLPDAERVGLRAEVTDEFNRVVEDFGDVCMEKKDELQRIIDEDIALGRAVGRILIEVMGAALAGVGPIAGRAAGAAVATDLPSVVARGVDAASRTNMLRTMYRALEVLPVRGGKVDYPEQATIQMITQLQESFESVAEELTTSLRQLDDGELRALKFALKQLTRDHLEDRLGTFVTAYTEQVQPSWSSPVGPPGPRRIKPITSPLPPARDPNSRELLLVEEFRSLAELR